MSVAATKLFFIVLVIAALLIAVETKKKKALTVAPSATPAITTSSPTTDAATTTAPAATNSTMEANTVASASASGNATSTSKKLTRVIVISDLHLGSQWMKNGGMFNNLCRFLSEIISNDDLNIQRLILLGMLYFKYFTHLGDTIEMWNFKYTEKPLTAYEIMSATNFHQTNINYFFSLIRGYVKHFKF
jgi:hypothetical protein